MMMNISMRHTLMLRLSKVKNRIYLTSPKKYEGSIFYPMIEFKQTASSIDFEDIDTLMFTSKQAVYTTENIDRLWRKFDSIAIGSATKKAIIQKGGRVIFQPKNFYGENLAREIVSRFKNRKILYLRPESIVFDSKKFLKRHGIELKEQIIYRTECKKYGKLDKPIKSSIIVFTSPSTIKCFLKNFGWDDSFIAIVIGESTKQHIPTGSRFFVAEEPTIDACMRKAREVLNFIKDV